MKYALLIGINYTGTASELRGCINDVESMKRQLVQQHKYDEGNITILTDLTDVKPTKHNILTILQSFSYQDDLTEFFFHYSGHGSYTKDYNHDEQDGKDECLVSIDNQYVLDDELKAMFDRIHSPIFCLFDCCHSGTALDLGFQYNFFRHKWITVGKSCSNTNVMMISGCTDKQTSADAYINGKFQGAMTYAFLSSMARYQHRPNIMQLVLGMRNILRKGNFKQLPQLNCNKNADLKSKWL